MSGVERKWEAPDYLDQPTSSSSQEDSAIRMSDTLLTAPTIEEYSNATRVNAPSQQQTHRIWHQPQEAKRITQ
jgi:hypothetical protein